MKEKVGYSYKQKRKRKRKYYADGCQAGKFPRHNIKVKFSQSKFICMYVCTKQEHWVIRFCVSAHLILPCLLLKTLFFITKFFFFSTVIYKTSQNGLPNLSLRCIHCDMCGNCSILRHFLLLPLLLSEPPEIERRESP